VGRTESRQTKINHLTTFSHKKFNNLSLLKNKIHDWREDGRYPVPGSCVTITNPYLLSNGEKWVNPEI
jgi:hypothetical protein